MQKVITVSIDVNKLVSATDDTFAVGQPEVLNELLSEGWTIEDWSFLTDNPVNGKVPMLVVLSDDLLIDEAYDAWEEEDELLLEDAGREEGRTGADHTGSEL